MFHDSGVVTCGSVSGSLSCKNERIWYFAHTVCPLHCSYLIELLELHQMEENVLQDAFCIPLIFIQLWCHAHNLSTFPYIKFKIIIGAWEGGQERYNSVTLIKIHCFIYKVLNLHLLVSCAKRTFSEENASSRSNKSNMGGGKSLSAGGKT